MAVTDSHMRVLAYLNDHDGTSLVDAATALDLPIAEVERLVGELGEAGMLTREPIH